MKLVRGKRLDEERQSLGTLADQLHLFLKICDGWPLPTRTASSIAT
jgi:hypothetical protein